MRAHARRTITSVLAAVVVASPGAAAADSTSMSGNACQPSLGHHANVGYYENGITNESASALVPVWCPVPNLVRRGLTNIRVQWLRVYGYDGNGGSDPASAHFKCQGHLIDGFGSITWTLPRWLCEDTGGCTSPTIIEPRWGTMYWPDPFGTGWMHSSSAAGVRCEIPTWVGGKSQLYHVRVETVHTP